jgi:menaquinone-dependent protoporphyrinogen IX oxidase
MKGLIIFKGKYGATRQYAEWIGEELQLPVYAPDSLPAGEIEASDFLVIGASVYTGKLMLKEWLHKNLVRIKNKKLFLFVVCGTPANKTEVLDQIVRLNVPAEIRNQVSVYFLRGRVVMKQLSWSHKLLLAIASRITKDADEKKRMREGFDFVKKENVTPLLNAVKAIFPKAERPVKWAAAT